MTLKEVTDAALAAERASFESTISRLESEKEYINSRLASCTLEIGSLKAELEALNSQLLACVKPIPRGIFTRASLSPQWTSTIQLYWSAVETSPGVYDWTVLDTLLASASAPVRLRPMLGVRAPSWWLTVPYVEPQGGESVLIPNVWLPDYQEAARAFIAALAEHVDNDNRVALVFATAGMTYYAEPFIRGTSSVENRASFLKHGYTMDADAALQTWQLDIMKVFKRTNVGLAYNPWQYITLDGQAGQSVDFMAGVMDHHLNTFGGRSVLQNNSIRSSYITDPPSFYQAFIDRPQAVKQFQCAATSRVGDESATIRWAIDVLGASGIEHSNTLTTQEYSSFDSEMKGA